LTQLLYGLKLEQLTPTLNSNLMAPNPLQQLGLDQAQLQL